MKTSMYFLLLIMVLAAAPAIGFAKTNTVPSKPEVAQQFEVWNSALQTGDAHKVAALYCEPGGVLIPTLSNKIRSNRAEIADYFEHFLLLKPSGRIDQSFIRVLGPDLAINAGIYTFHLVKDGKTESVQARYTFVYAKQHGRWCIMEQHSSAMPESDAKQAVSH
ncbi:MAG: SgcJ/EcaC family oxidoreductase [Gammaproteobacteria bacterium]